MLIGIRWVALLMLLAVFPPASAEYCRNDIPATAPDSRFTANGDGTVTDHATGLIWKQCPEGRDGSNCSVGNLTTLDWQRALQEAEKANFAGSTDWRLPSINELESLVEQRCYAPAINANFFSKHTFRFVLVFFALC